jgi:hypothetical protein
LFKRPYLEKSITQKKAGGVAQGVGPEFKPSHRKKDSEDIKQYYNSKSKSKTAV